jgi:hypothetical protein
MDLTDDTLLYLCSFLQKSTAKSLSLTCKDYSDKLFTKGNLGKLCCKCDDDKLFNKLVLTPNNKHLSTILNYGSFNLFEQLNKYDYSGTTLMKSTLSILAIINSNIAETDYEYTRILFACNIVLVSEGARNAFYCDLFKTKKFVEELQRESGFFKRRTNIYSVKYGEGILYLRMSYLSEATKIVITHSPSVGMCKLLDYGHTEEDYNIDSFIISFNLVDNNCYSYGHLYRYRCPKTKYTDTVQKHNKEKVKSFNRILLPLGYKVVCEVVQR